MDLDSSEFVPDLDPTDLQEPAVNDEYVKVDKEQGAGDGSSSPEVISGPEGEEGEPLPSTTDAMADVDAPLIEEPEDEDTVPTIEPPPIPKMAFATDPTYCEDEVPFIPPEEPPEDFTPPELPSSQPGVTGAGVEDVLTEGRTIKPFITSHTEGFPSSSKVKQSDLPKATGYLSFLSALHPVVLQIIYWRDVQLSAASLVSALGILCTLCMNTVLHAVVLVLLASMVVSLVYIVTKVAIDSFYNREIQNPFLTYLKRDFSIPEKKVVDITLYVLKHVNCSVKCLVRLVFFDKITDSLKFMVTLFLVSYVTNCLDVLTSLFMAVVLLFSVPPVYSHYQDQIDLQVKRYLTKLTHFYTKVSHKIPFLPKVKEE